MTDDFFSSALEELERRSLTRRPRVFEACDGRTVTFGGAKYLLFCSNDYLGLSHDERIAAAVMEGVAKYGFGSGGSRLISGTRPPHAELEAAIARYLRAEAAVSFGSGYCANTGIIPAVAGRGDAILADRLNHASLTDGCRLSQADFFRYPHADTAALEKLLVKTSSARNRWIITDGLFSMDGDAAPLDVICGLAEKHGARVYVDDAHAFGVLGENGRGSASLCGVEGRIDLTVGTLGKAAGGTGAFAVGKKSVVDYLVNKARSFIFSTAMPPAAAEGNLKAVEILADCGERRREFLDSVRAFGDGLKRLGFAASSESYIIPLVIGGAAEALAAANAFWEKGIFIQAVRPPAVPEGGARLRLTLSHRQSPQDREAVLSAIGTIIVGR
ncbi:MAG: 8-amino-7-oxononanoate synthase [Nitrospinae bacterium]|nr:8-amino-7-oxononanoate synthase [Nitrospinota bacterium]